MIAMSLIKTHPALPSQGSLASTFPWRPLESIHLLVDGDCFYPRMLEAIGNARESIYLEIYYVQPGRVADQFIEALGQAVQRGVSVRLLLDSIGAREFSAADHKHVSNAGIQLRLYNPLARKKFAMNLSRDHRKILIIDRTIAFTGGAGIADVFDLSANPQKAWHDLMIESQGPVVADWCELFEQAWMFYNGMPDLPIPTRISSYLHISRYFRPLTGVPSQTRVNSSNGVGDEQIKADLVKRIRAAKRRAWIATAYFYPSRKLRRALIRAAGNGIDVRLLLPGPRTDHPAVRYASRRYYGQLLRHGVMILEYQPRFMHMKIALADDWVSVGSCNFDRWNLRWNLEANQEILDVDFAAQIRALFEADFKDSEAYSAVNWARRRWWTKFQELFWFQIGRLIEFMSLHIKRRRP
ncbi:Phospholipase D family protein [gamma proteobacterium HdN1]|nr:Phospholipase D family protein [gamma proteobacterium HdN1]